MRVRRTTNDWKKILAVVLLADFSLQNKKAQRTFLLSYKQSPVNPTLVLDIELTCSCLPPGPNLGAAEFEPAREEMLPQFSLNLLEKK